MSLIPLNDSQINTKTVVFGVVLYSAKVMLLNHHWPFLATGLSAVLLVSLSVYLSGALLFQWDTQLQQKSLQIQWFCFQFFTIFFVALSLLFHLGKLRDGTLGYYEQPGLRFRLSFLMILFGFFLMATVFSPFGIIVRNPDGVKLALWSSVNCLIAFLFFRSYAIVEESIEDYVRDFKHLNPKVETEIRDSLAVLLYRHEVNQRKFLRFIGSHYADGSQRAVRDFLFVELSRWRQMLEERELGGEMDAVLKSFRIKEGAAADLRYLAERRGLILPNERPSRRRDLNDEISQDQIDDSGLHTAFWGLYWP